MVGLQGKKQKAEAQHTDSVSTAVPLPEGAGLPGRVAGPSADAVPKPKLSREEKARERELRARAKDDTQKHKAQVRCPFQPVALPSLSCTASFACTASC